MFDDIVSRHFLDFFFGEIHMQRNVDNLHPTDLLGLGKEVGVDGLHGADTSDPVEAVPGQLRLGRVAF